MFSFALVFSFFFFNDTATTEIYTLSLHDALPIFFTRSPARKASPPEAPPRPPVKKIGEHTSELQSHLNLVCRLLLEKKKRTHRSHSAQNIKNKNKNERKHQNQH